MRIFNILSTLTFTFLLLTLDVHAAHRGHRDSSCRDDRRCQTESVDAPEARLKVVRGSIQLDSLVLESDGDIVSSTASIARGRKFSITSPSDINPHFVRRLPDIITGNNNLLPPSLLFTRVYELDFNVHFDCEYRESPTVLLQIESNGTFSAGSAYVANFNSNVLNVTKSGFTVHAFIYINGTIGTGSIAPLPPFISDNVSTIANSLAGKTRINFEAIGRR